MPCVCVACTSILDKHWTSGITSKKKLCHQPVTNCTYWTVLSSFNICNIIQLLQKSTPFQEFEEKHKVVIDGISDNMASLVQSGTYSDINTSGTSTNGYSVLKFISEAYRLQNNTTIDRENITAGELVVKAQYL